MNNNKISKKWTLYALQSYLFGIFFFSNFCGSGQTIITGSTVSGGAEDFIELNNDIPGVQIRDVIGGNHSVNCYFLNLNGAENVVNIDLSALGVELGFSPDQNEIVVDLVIFEAYISDSKDNPYNQIGIVGSFGNYQIEIELDYYPGFGAITGSSALPNEGLPEESWRMSIINKTTGAKTIVLEKGDINEEIETDDYQSQSIEGTVRLICGSHVTNKIPLLAFVVGLDDALCYGTSGPMSPADDKFKFGTYFRIDDLPAHKNLLLVLLMDNSLGYFVSQQIELEENEKLVLKDEFIRCNEFLFDIPYQDLFAFFRETFPQLTAQNNKKEFIEALKKSCLSSEGNLDQTFISLIERFDGEYFHHSENPDIPEGYRILLEKGELYFQYIGRSKEKYKLENKKGSKIDDLEFSNVQSVERINYNDKGEAVTNTFGNTTWISFRETEKNYILEVQTHARGFGWNQSFFKAK